MQYRLNVGLLAAALFAHESAAFGVFRHGLVVSSCWGCPGWLPVCQAVASFAGGAG